jgi:hypothetical protein
MKVLQTPAEADPSGSSTSATPLSAAKPSPPTALSGTSARIVRLIPY